MKKEDKTNSIEDIFGPVIHAYTRAEAIDDGVLVDVSELAKEAGIRLPTAITSAVHARYVEVPEELKGHQDEVGRLWDILWMFSCAVRSGKLHGAQGTFEVIVANLETAALEANEKPFEQSITRRLVTLKAVCGPADDGSPCITIMQPSEE